MKSKHSSNKKSFTLYTNPFSNLKGPVNTAMDWSADTHTPTSLPPCVSPAGEHVPLPHVSLLQGSEADNSTINSNVKTIVLNCGNNQFTELSLSLWDGSHQALLIFRSENSIITDTTNIESSLRRITTYISQHPITSPQAPEELNNIVKIMWNLINTIYTSK